MQTYVIWLKVHWIVFTRIQWTICLHWSSSPRWVLNVFLWFMITNKISTEISLQGNLLFYECPHTCLNDVTSMYVYKHNLFISIYILRIEGSVYIHILLHFIIFQQYRKKYLLSLSSMNSLRSVDAYMCQESNLAFVNGMSSDRRRVISK